MNLADVDRVSAACDCTTSRAKALLRMNGNDADKAIGFFNSFEKLKEPVQPPGGSKTGNDAAGARGADNGADSANPASSANDNNDRGHDHPATQAGDDDGSSGDDTANNHNNHGLPNASDADGNPDDKHGSNPLDQGIGSYNHHGLRTPPGEDGIHASSTNNDEGAGASSMKEKSALNDNAEDIGSGNNADQGHEVSHEPEAIHESASELASVEEILEDGHEDQVPREWDLRLPVIEDLGPLVPGGTDGQSRFWVRHLVSAIQKGATPADVRAYLQYYDPKIVSRCIVEVVENIPAIFYAVGSNNEWIVREFINAGAKVDVLSPAPGIPLLAYTIMNSELIDADTNNCVATLLSLGASPQHIPAAFYTPFSRDLPNDGPDEESLGDLESHELKWSKSESIRFLFARNLNLTQRYHLHRATKIKKPTIRERQVAKLRKASPLLGLPYFLIGQTAAAEMLRHQLVAYMLRDIARPGRRPLALLFAGPSGHGKTELARRLGHLLSLDLEVVDCTSCQRESELFGAKHPYAGAAQGSPLNNFLARRSGQRSIVFLDEFDRTSKEVHNALLIPFDKGVYEDRRNRATVDCSKTIWVLATNAFDESIHEYYGEHEEVLSVDEDHPDKPKLIKKLSKLIKDESIEQFGAPMTGRLSAVLPFLPFTKGEQLVGAHKGLLEFTRELRTPIKMTGNGEADQLLGNIRLKTRRDAAICTLIAEDYDAKLGLRSLITAVEGHVIGPVIDGYLAVEEEIQEKEGLDDYKLDLQDGELIVRRIIASPPSDSFGDETI